MKHILVVDDEPSIVILLEYTLKQAGYKVSIARDGKAAYDMISSQNFDLVLLDIMLPKMDGMEVCRRIRQERIQVPIIMLTAKSEEYDKIIGLELGADDYITKPFSPREVIARIKAVSRRTNSPSNRPIIEKNDALENQPLSSEDQSLKGIVNCGDIQIDLDHFEVLVRGEKVELTPKEYELLVYFTQRQGRIISRDQLLNQIWNFDYAGETRIVDVHISHLREKIEEDTKSPKYIKTVRGFGYKFEVPRV
ncbi:response regulator transcription factor [Facklamia hominis]|uniref:response regulator transcription factor n=1 Tax=Facklamia hominis TaxID=178214 RepID=UPI00101DCEE5|nr:response regulator transcription factor [Facklamia hominis]RYC98492.1 response regulator transcription factor [Facklamia hominis]